jgi:rhodanese-related sulfurtransferase
MVITNTKVIFNIVLICSIALQACSQNTPTHKKEGGTILKVIPHTEFAQKMTDLNSVIIDVRTTPEWKKGYIKGALHLDIFNDNFELEIDKLDKQKTYLVYCASGGRSAEAAEIMAKKGFVEVYDLEGGFTKWKQHNGNFIVPAYD